MKLQGGQNELNMWLRTLDGRWVINPKYRAGGAK